MPAGHRMGSCCRTSSMSGMEVLNVTSLTKTYGNGGNMVYALKNACLRVTQGEFVAVVGTSGSGKSTFLNLIGGLDAPDSGRIVISGRDICGLRRRERTIFRRRNIGFIFQNYSLMPVLNVYDNVALPVSFDRGQKIDHDYIRALLSDLGLWEKRLKYPSELSGGQQQRTAIARALANTPAMILADEPTGNLDSRTTSEVMGLLKNSARKYNQTILMVTHNEILANSSDRIIRIEDGVLWEEGEKNAEAGVSIDLLP